MRAFSALCIISLHVGVTWATLSLPSVAQEVSPTPQNNPLPTPPPGMEVSPDVNNGISPQMTKYILGPGDVLQVQVQRPPGPHRLAYGDSISVIVQRFPDLSFATSVNIDGNILLPLAGPLSVKNLTLQEAQTRIRARLNQYVIEPVVIVALTSPRPDLNLSLAINPEGTVLLPQVGTVTIQGLTVEEAQEKIRLALKNLYSDPVVSTSLGAAKPVQVTVGGEVFRPGIYSVPSSIPRVNDVLQVAGGSTLMADLRQIQVRRRLIDGTVVSQTIDLYTPLQNGSNFPNFRLQDGDAIVIPRREVATDNTYDRNLIARSSLAQPQIKIRVMNYAAGGISTQAIPNGSTFIDVLSGISLDTTNLQDIALIRFDPERGRAVTQRLNGKKALAGDISQNVPLQDNDVIVIGRNLVGKITNLLTTITRPFFDVQNFLRFFETLGGGGSDSSK
ncbi:polysaccharide biosynthesis/export family protein [Calothrix sp. 336/3]|uniref:polysaccharide biosynthesis/export family protein n=1 Tax=Calothrix sp. 336/3 TaxID=1337936 RepID=UPI0004E31AB4|nr:polysaccharide biosynthesis/export family protein [Calothrix sp. 336/3]AKG22007.1 sugar ABC transporter substrate-binding protein [Calothrix sp. 336/3]